MHVISIATACKGGIDSVINGYISDGLYDGVQHTRINSHNDSGFFSKIILFVKSFFYLLYLLILKRNVCLHLHMSFNGSFYRKFLFMCLGNVFFARTVIHLHGSEFKDFYFSSFAVTRFLIKIMILASDEFIVLSKSWSDFIYQISGKTPTIINNYVNVPKVNSIRKKGHILFLGALIERKGIYDLLYSLSNLKSDFHLHIAGDGEFEKVSKLVGDLGLTDQVTMHGWVDTKTKYQLLSSCELFVLPSYNEGLPMVLIEAMGASIPVVITPVGGIPEVIEDRRTGYIFQPGDIHGLTSTLQEALEQDNSSIVRNALTLYRSNFTPGVALPKLKKVYGLTI